jgi:hypothetical protein
VTTLYFTSHRTEWGRLYWARPVDDLYFLIYESRYGLCGQVSDVSKASPIIHQIDRRGVRMHPDEIKRQLQSWLDEQPLDFLSRTSTLDDVDKKETQ